MRRFLTGLGAWLLVGQVLATPVTVTFEGTIQSANGSALFGSLLTGAAFSGSFVYESTAPGVDSVSQPGLFTYSNAVTSASYSLGGFSYTAALGGDVFVSNRSVGDDFFAGGQVGFGGAPIGPAIAGLNPLSWGFQLSDPTGGLFSDSNLPLFIGPDALPEGLFSRMFGVQFRSSDGQILGQAQGAVTSYTFTAPIPEPETYAMLLVGLGLLGWRIRPQRLQSLVLGTTGDETPQC